MGLRLSSLAIVLAALAAQPAFAARPVLQHGHVKSQDMAMVLATIHDVAETTEASVTDPKVIYPGFRFKLKLVEVIRQGKLDKKAREVPIAFSSSGYATNWEEGEKPVEGLKVLAHLWLSEKGELELYGYPGGVVVLKGFDDSEVQVRRKIVALWEVDDPKEQLRQVLAGCSDKLPEFQQFCISSLADLDGTWTGVDLQRVLTRDMALSHLWQLYSANMGTSFEAISSCENVFWNEYRGAGWESHEARYEILSRAVRSLVAARREVHHSQFDSCVMALCHYPEHGRENYELLLKILDGPIDIYKSAASIRLEMPYEPHTTNKEVADLNRDIFAKLVELLGHENPSISDGAAIALGQIAMKYAQVGPVPAELLAILKGEAKVNEDAKTRLNSYLRQIATVAPPKLPPDVHVLAHPWDELLEKKVITAARSCFRDGKHGASIEVGRRRIWIDGLDAWPDTIGGSKDLLVTGKLTKVADLEVFRYQDGKPLEDGLPVPEGYSLEKARERYVLVGATWEVRRP
jgi:hypothetical protein